ncbi:diguanylate cyclase, partial [Acinetobacter baumannii]
MKNRRALDVALENEWDRLQRNDSRLSVLFIDADHFKRYNDAHGHAQGDVALQYLAQCISKHARRRGDLAARYGGEEFVVLLPDTGETGATRIA